MRRLLRIVFDALWDLQEAIAIRYYGTEPVGPPDRVLFRIRVTPYPGEPIVLPDGTSVGRRESYGELHFQNRTVRALHRKAERPRQVGFLFAEALVEGLRQLAMLAATDPRYADVPAFCGVTMLHYGAEKLGFHVRPLQAGPRARRIWLYQRLLTARYHPAGWSRVEQGTRVRDSREVWISRRELLSRYAASQEGRQGNEQEARIP
jgi:peptidoglycan-N-acetylglucosamine deacetylase